VILAVLWIGFARTGNSNHIGIPNWPSYELEKRATIIFDKEVKVEDEPLKVQRLAWDGML